MRRASAASAAGGVGFDGFGQALDQIEPHRDAPAGAIASRRALAPAARPIERHGERAGRATEDGVQLRPDAAACQSRPASRRARLHQRRQEDGVAADAHAVALQARRGRRR